MSRYKPDRFNFSQMSERVTFQEQNSDGSYTDNITVWAHILKDGFTRSENDNWFKVMVREQGSLESLLAVGNRLKWKQRLLSIFSWQDPSYEDRGFIEIITKQIVSPIGGAITTPTDSELFGDIISVYRLIKVEVNKFGLITYEYKYDFSQPLFTGVRCKFSTDRNRYIDDKRTDVEHDSTIVRFSIDAPIQKEDYIISPIHGKFKVDMIVKTPDNMIEAYVNRTEVQ